MGVLSTMAGWPPDSHPRIIGISAIPQSHVFQVFTGHIKTLSGSGWFLHSAQDGRLCVWVCVCVTHCHELTWWVEQVQVIWQTGPQNPSALCPKRIIKEILLVLCMYSPLLSRFLVLPLLIVELSLGQTSQVNTRAQPLFAALYLQ